MSDLERQLHGEYWWRNVAKDGSTAAGYEECCHRLAAELKDAKNDIERLQGIIQFGETASRQQLEGFQAEIERLKAALQAIARCTAPSTRTFDGIIRDMGLANDLARAALEGK